MILIFTLTHDTETKETCLISNVTPTEAGLTILRQLVTAPIKRELPKGGVIEKGDPAYQSPDQGSVTPKP